MNDLPQLVYMYFGDKLSLKLGKKRRLLTGLGEERAEEILAVCTAYKSSPTEELYQKLLDIISPIQRLTGELEGIIQKEDGKYYMEGTSAAIPEGLAKLLLDYKDKGIPTEPLKNFWTLCLLNPNQQARDDFFRYINEYGITITDNGYVLLYKAVNKQEKDARMKLDEYLSSKYLKVKDEGHDPSNFIVYIGKDSEEYYTSDHEGHIPSSDEMLVELGSLKQLYKHYSTGKDKDEQTKFEPSRTGDYGMDIVIGEAQTMPREECDPNINVGCSYGLHVGSYDYVSGFGYNMDTILAVLVNPRDIVALPKHDNSKIRTCRYFVYAVIERDEEGEWEELDSQYFEDDFADMELKQVRRQLKNLSDPTSESDRNLGMDKEEVQAILEKRLVSLEK